MTYRPAPSDIARQTSGVAARTARNRAAPLRRAFCARVPPDGDSRPPPLAQLVGGRSGRGGDVSLKLYLSIVWFASADDHAVSKPSRSWAQLLDLEDPEGRGARRVANALRKLESLHLVEIDRRPGDTSRVTLLRDDGSGAAYEYPARTIERLRGTDGDTAEMDRHYFFRLSASFWTDGWVADLTAAETACLLALGQEYRDNRGGPSDRRWISPQRWVDKYALSESTRSKGFQSLRSKDLVWIGRRPVDESVFDRRRMRNTYSLTPTSRALLPDSRS